MSDPVPGEASAVAQPPAAAEPAIAPHVPAGRTGGAPPPGRARRRMLAATGLTLAALVVVLIVTDPFAGSGKPTGGVADNAAATSLVSVKRQTLSQQTQVSGTLGYGGSSSIRVPPGTAPSTVEQAARQVASAEAMLARAREALSADARVLAGSQGALAAARAKEQVDCAGAGAAEAVPAGGESGGGGGAAGPCAGDSQAVSSAQQGETGAGAKVAADRLQVSSAEAQLASARSGLSAARSSAALYGQSSAFTSLPPVGRIVARGQSPYAIGGQPVLLLYGTVPQTRAFVAGMAPGSDVAELNANLRALGYGAAPGGDAFTAGTEAAIRALQAARGATASGELLLGSVVFEPGAVRVTSVTPTVGSPVTPGPVLAITSTSRQVKLALDASEQDTVKVGDPVTITLPDNSTTPGRITYVSSVATAPATGGSGHGGAEEEGSPTIEVRAVPTDPAATGHLDQAPVNVEITTESAPNVLAVPVDALLALAGGGYAVEVAEGRVHHLVAVGVGLFDDAEGLAQVSGKLSPGERVVVPAP